MTLHLLRSSIGRLPGRLAGVRGLQTTPAVAQANTSNTPSAPATGTTEVAAPTPKELAEAAEKARYLQAPNRATTWSKSQRPRALAMTGPRFEQTDLTKQPAPWAAIELIHQQPVRWSEKRVVECNGGGWQ
jgi:NADH dehydrogenase (ubiquinone) Fe-S protein 6